mgnify:CR=1 FL=1
MPFGDQLAVAHVRLLDVLARFDAGELRHHAVENVGGVLRLGHVERADEPQLDELRVAQVVEAEEVGARLFERRSVAFQLVTLHARCQLARTVPETFVQVGVEVVADLAVFVDALAVFGA